MHEDSGKIFFFRNSITLWNMPSQATKKKIGYVETCTTDLEWLQWHLAASTGTVWYNTPVVPLWWPRHRPHSQPQSWWRTCHRAYRCGQRNEPSGAACSPRHWLDLRNRERNGVNNSSGINLKHLIGFPLGWCNKTNCNSEQKPTVKPLI